MTLDLTVTRTFDVPVEQVWRAWTESEYVKQWWGPAGFTAPIAAMDVREGGASLDPAALGLPPDVPSAALS